MSDGSLKLTASADFNRLENELDSLRKKHAKLEDQVGKSSKAFRGMESASEKSFNAISSRIQGTIATYMGLSRVIDLVINGMHEEIEINRRAGFASRNVADAKRQLLSQTGQFTDEQRERFMSSATDIGAKHGIRESEAILSLQQPLSATFGDTEARIAQSLDVFSTFAPLFVGRMEEAGPVMAAVLDAQRTMGGSAKEVTNFLLAALSQTRLTGLESLPNLIRTLAASQAITRAPDPVQAAREVTALFGAFQALTGEAEGAITSTAITNFLAVMSEQAEERGIQPSELLKMVRSDEDLAMQVAEKVLGRSFTKPVQREFLEEGNLIKAYQTQLKEFEAVDPKDLDSIVSFFSKDRDIAMDSALRRQQAKAEKFLKDDRAQTDIVREMLYGEQGAISTSGKGIGARIASRFSQLEFDYGPGDKFDVADRELSQRVFYQHMRSLWGGSIPFAPMVASGFAPFTGNDPLSVRSKDPEVLRLQDELRSLRELRDATRSIDSDKALKVLEKIEKNTSKAAVGATTSPVRISPGKYQEN